MRVRLAVVVATTMLCIPGTSEAQRQGAVELTPIVGYQWGGGGEIRRGSDVGTVKVQSSAAYGLAADFEVRRGVWVQALVYAQPTTLEFTELGSVTPTKRDFSTWYYHLGGLFEAIDSGPVTPFGVVSLGATQMNPADVSSEWFFSFSFGGGVKYYLSERVALRAQARAWVSALSGGTGFYIGTGGSGVSTWIGETSTQGELSLGLSFVM